MPNRLVDETSPYLLQHSENPVEWYPWGEEALSRARAEDRPILLSIGYSACHWCHVMERESFQDPETAAQMNSGFVNIKVDREERPDLDSIYMRALQATSGRGGWPLTAFLTPDGRFFYGGTYFPPQPRYGMPSFPQVLAAALDAYRRRRTEVEEGADRILRLLRVPPSTRAEPSPPLGVPGEASHGSDFEGPEAILATTGPSTVARAAETLATRFDPAHGGFGPAPKFPQPTTLEFLLRYFARTGDQRSLDMVLTTLRAMARGGIRDHLGGGFHRYSVDHRWLVPHFEKMLYDNGLLARVYLHAFQITGDQEFRDVVASTLDYILEDLQDPKGGFYGARDADSEGEEGAFYLWSSEQIRTVLGNQEGAWFSSLYGVTPEGNFEGRTILNLADSLPSLAQREGVPVDELTRRARRARTTLREARKEREEPFRDEKVLVAWNSFVLRALAEAGPVLGRPEYVEAAIRNADFLLNTMKHENGLYRSWKDGRIRVRAFLEDYAGLGNALLDLYESTLAPRWLLESEGLVNQILDRFWEEEEGLFYDSPRDGEALVVRPRDIMDNATPSGNSLALELLLRHHAVFGNPRYRDIAVRGLIQEMDAASQIPSAFGEFLSGLDRALEPPLEVTVLGDPERPETRDLLEAAHLPYLPSLVLVGGDPDLYTTLPLLEGRKAQAGRATAYVCREQTCSLPILEPLKLASELEARSAGPGVPREDPGPEGDV